MKDASKIGADRGTQNPQDEIERQTGKYDDAADKMSEDDRFQGRVMPMAPGPNPFKSFNNG